MLKIKRFCIVALAVYAFLWLLSAASIIATIAIIFITGTIAINYAIDATLASTIKSGLSQ